ncbi:restriction endonuclease subunit S [Mycoplasmopsis felis]|uniref:restriction endonuclease subunit S n=1 Tax=Mycoplasmopsis felis TaxID=33923 RepID=UPI002DD44CEF|nr:restriction endonuclease subunit S [Mycoplasmopsis felis]WRX06695.1 restriction endonuclease subunit S [Mycoplasmopsis felis]
MKKVLFPRVRFKGFSEDWKEDTIRNIANITNGKLDANAMVKSGMYNFYTSGIDVYKIDKYSFEGEGISIAGNGVNMGYMHLVSGKYNAYQRTYILNNIKIDRHFLFYNLWKNFWEFCQKNTREGSIPYLLYDDISDFKIFKSHSNEQQKIGKLLENIDNLITLEEIKLNKLKQLKETLLQKMFPEPNSKTPKIRFRGFNEEWSEERFGDTIEPYRIKNYNNEKLQSYSISNKFGFVNQKEFFENGGKAIRANKSNSLVVFPNSFAYNPARIDVGSIGLYKKEENCLVSPIYEVFKTDRKMNDEFLFNWFKIDKFKWIVNKSKEGSVRNTVYLKNISDYLINFPSYSEQQKIGDFFSKIDTLLNLYLSKLNKLKQIKEALLQKMFV